MKQRRPSNGPSLYVKRKPLSFRKIIAVDFDGTLSLGKFPSCGPANQEFNDLLKKILAHPLYERPWFVLWTSREGGALQAAVDWLEEQGIIFDAINENPKKRSVFGKSRKILADWYVDDRAIKPDDFITLCRTVGL